MVITAFVPLYPVGRAGSGLSLLPHTFTPVVSTPFLITSRDMSRMSSAEEPERALAYVGVDACT